MRVLKDLLQIPIVLFLCLSVWLLVRMTGLVMSAFPPDNLDHVPANAELAVRIDARQIAETTVQSILLESKDEQIIRLLEKAVSQGPQNNSTFSNSGINFLSDIVVFSYPYGKGKISGILYNLLDQDAFLKNMPERIGQNGYCAASETVGTVINYNPKENETINRSKLRDEAQSIVANKKGNDRSVLHSGHKTGRYTELFLQTGTNSKNPQKIQLVFEQKGREFLMDGSVLSQNGNSTDKLPFVLKERGLHITNSIFTDQWADSLKNMLSFLSADFPEISGFSINYGGMKLVNHTTGYIALPEIDMVVNCARPFSIEGLINAEGIKGDLDYSANNGEILIGKERFYYKQLNSTCFYIGRSKSPQLVKTEEKVLLKITGSLAPLTRITGSGWGISLLKLLPIYQASNKLAASTEEINLCVVKTSSKNSTLTGSLSFKPGFYPMSEVMRFLLVSQLVNSN